MKLGPREAFHWLASFGLRMLFRGAFLLLALATVAMALFVLQEEKQRSYANYRKDFLKSKEQVLAKLRHPTGQLALLNAPIKARALTPLHPVLLPYASIDFDDQNKVRNVVEMTGCMVRYRHNGAVCVAIGSNPWAGGFIYVAGTFASAPLAAHTVGDAQLDTAHRIRVSVSMRGDTTRWIAPFEPIDDAGARRVSGLRGRLTGFEDSGGDFTHARPVRDFRGWIWQDANCVAPSQDAAGCARLSFFSIRLPVAVLRDALFAKQKPEWPPHDLADIQVRVEALGPESTTPLLDSNDSDAVAPFSLDELPPLLQPGQSLVIARADAPAQELVRLAGPEVSAEESWSLLRQLIRRLPVDDGNTALAAEDEVTTAVGGYVVRLSGDVRSANRTLSVVATRLVWFVAAMLVAIALTWLILEIGIIRRIALLTRRASDLSRSARASGGLEQFDLAQVRGRDELGILARALNDLLRRVKEDAERERIRAGQERDMWHAVGHEIMSPLQSLMVLHGKADDPASRYIHRMQQAVRVLYGSASPSEAFETSTLQVEALDIDAFLAHVAGNAHCIGIADVGYAPLGQPVMVRGDEYSLEDVVTHILRNADRHRTAGTPITLDLELTEHAARIRIHNIGPRIPESMLDTIFEYGVSGKDDGESEESRGQGLFVARTYMAKMSGTIAAQNDGDGVSFVLTLLRA